MENLIFLGGVIVFAVVALLVIGLIITRLYQRAPKDTAFVRTGAGGQKVIKDGGALVLPVLHEITPVNMKTLRLEVVRKDNEGLITKDNLRVDVSCAFFVRVKPDAESIANAAQTLGRSTLNPGELSLLMNDKFVDALRSVAASMDMDELHAKRSDFVQSVQTTLSEDLSKNGLELENVSLTALDQTDSKYLNPNNAFDAKGLAKLVQITEQKRQERNEIEQTARVAIETRNLKATEDTLKLKQAQEFATLENEREIETRRAEQEAQLAQQRAQRKREADIATIEAERATEIERTKKNQLIKSAEIEAQKAIRIAEQEQAIVIAAKSEEESKARAAADAARAEAVTAEQSVITAAAIAEAERAKNVAVVQAQQEAEQEATRVRIAAQAEADAADLQAQARLKLADVTSREDAIKAAGVLALNEAANKLGDAQLTQQQRLALIEKLPEILAQMVKPMENVDSVRIVSMPGFNGGATSGNASAGNGNVPQNLTNALLDYRLQSPLVDTLAREVGIDLNKGLNGLLDSALPAATPSLEAIEAAINADNNPDTGIIPGVGEVKLDELRKQAGIKTDRVADGK